MFKFGGDAEVHVPEERKDKSRSQFSPITTKPRKLDNENNVTREESKEAVKPMFKNKMNRNDDRVPSFTAQSNSLIIP